MSYMTDYPDDKETEPPKIITTMDEYDEYRKLRISRIQADNHDRRNSTTREIPLDYKEAIDLKSQVDAIIYRLDNEKEAKLIQDILDAEKMLIRVDEMRPATKAGKLRKRLCYWVAINNIRIANDKFNRNRH